jgi:hypothetical protein
MGGDGAEGKRGPALRRELALKLAAPDLAKDTAGSALVVDIAAIDLGADEIAEPLSTLADGKR